MSLAGSLKQFQSERADAVSRNIQHARPSAAVVPPRSSTSTPKPTPATEKRSHDAAFAAGPPVKNEGVGREMMSHVVFTITFLRQNSPEIIPWSRITSWLSLPQDLKKNLPFIKRALQTNDRATYLSASESGLPQGQDGFKYRPLHPVTNGEELREYLATMDSARGISVKELKDGWPDCAATLDLLESRGQILVARNKKDNAARLVWPDNASFHPPNTHLKSASTTDIVGKVDPDFIDFWSKIKLPANDNDVRAELERAGLTPTSAVKEAKKVELKKGRKRAEKKNAKKTNVHMAGILKDYSGRKPGK